MNISFFEEFPTKQTLYYALKMIDFHTKLYLAAHSLNEFRELEKNVKRICPFITEAVYWVVLKKWEGYWISPFSVSRGLRRVLNEVINEPIGVMLDLEHPIHAPWLYLAGLPNFSRNKKFIKEFIEYRERNNQASTYLIELSGDEERLKFWGLHYDSETAYVCKMCYTSLKKLKLGRSGSLLKLREISEQGVNKYGRRFKIGLGCIAKGIAGLEPLLSPDNLAEDLRIAKEIGVNEAIIFRLGGLNENYLKAIKSIK